MNERPLHSAYTSQIEAESGQAKSGWNPERKNRPRSPRFPLAVGLTMVCLALLSTAATGRTLRLVDSTTISDPTVGIPVVLDSDGDENSLSFSISYDPSVLSLTSFQPGASLQNALWLINTNQPGRVGLTLGKPGGERFQAGSNHLGQLIFLPKSPAGESEIRLADSPIQRLVVNEATEPLATAYRQGRLSYGPRTLRLAETQAVRSEEFETRLELIGSGVESSISFSTGFDSQSVEYVGFRPGNPDTSFIVNSRTPGKVGILLGLPAGQTFPAGTNVAGFLKFRSLPAARDSRLELIQEPVGLLVVNQQSAPLATLFESAQLRIGTRRLQIGSVSGPTGHPLVVPIHLVGSGVENAATFSLGFDPARLRFAGITPGPGVDPASVQINTTSIALGKLVIAAAAPSGTSLPPGGNTVLNLQFVPFGGSGQTSVSFEQSPVAALITSANGTPLVPALENGVITLLLPGLPVIASQPEAREARPGERVEFQVIAEGQGVLTYQWRKGGVDIPTATAPTLILPKVQPGDSSLYSVQIGNAQGTVISREVQLTVLTSPVFIRQPQSITALAGTLVRLDADVAGTPPLTYEWLKNGQTLANQNRPFIEFARALASDSGDYRLIVRNRSGETAQSDLVKVTVLEPPVIGTGLQNQSVITDASVVFRVTATGTPPLRYQWRLNGQNIAGATEATYSIARARLEDAGLYTVIVANDAGAITSQAAELRVDVPPAPVGDNFNQATLISGPGGAVSGSNRFATREGNAEPVHAGRSGGRSVWFRWRAPATGIVQFNTVGSSFDTLLAAYTGNSLSSLSPTASDDDRGLFFSSRMEFNVSQGVDYSIALDAFNAVGGNYVLAWTFTPAAIRAPEITSHPASQTVVSGTTVTLQVTAAGAQSFQWFFNGSLLAGQIQSSLRLDAIRESSVGSYSVAVTGPGGSTLSEPAVIEIGPQSEVRSVDKPELALPAQGFQRQDHHNHQPAIDPPGASQALRVSFGSGLSHIYSTSQATTEQFETAQCSFVGGRTRWLLIRADRSATLLVSATSRFETALSVHEGETLELIEANCASLNHTLRLPVQAAKSYWLRTDSAEEGAVTLDVVLGDAPAPVVQDPVERDLASGEELLLEPPSSLAAEPALTYQWKLNGVPIQGATGRQLRVNRPSKSAVYSVQASNPLGSVEVQVAKLRGSTPIRLLSEIASVRGDFFESAVEGTAEQGFEVQSSPDMANWSRTISGWFAESPVQFRQTLIGRDSGGIRFFRIREKEVEARVGNDLVDGTYEVVVDGGRIGSRYVLERRDGAGPWLPVTTNVVRGAEFFLHDRFPTGGQRPNYRTITLSR